MINRLIKNKEVIERCSHLIPQYKMTQKVWKKLTELRTVLKECYDLTVSLSRTDLIPTDSYIRWLECRFNIQDQENCDSSR